jgi:hypothetical protein
VKNPISSSFDRGASCAPDPGAFTGCDEEDGFAVGGRRGGVRGRCCLRDLRDDAGI